MLHLTLKRSKGVIRWQSYQQRHDISNTCHPRDNPGESSNTCASTHPEAGVNRREASRDLARAVTRSVSYWPAHIPMVCVSQMLLSCHIAQAHWVN